MAPPLQGPPAPRAHGQAWPAGRRRRALGQLAAAGRALEVRARRPLDGQGPGRQRARAGEEAGRLGRGRGRRRGRAGQGQSHRQQVRGRRFFVLVLVVVVCRGVFDRASRPRRGRGRSRWPGAEAGSGNFGGAEEEGGAAAECKGLGAEVAAAAEAAAFLLRRGRLPRPSGRPSGRDAGAIGSSSDPVAATRARIDALARDDGGGANGSGGGGGGRTTPPPAPRRAGGGGHGGGPGGGGLKRLSDVKVDPKLAASLPNLSPPPPRGATPLRPCAGPLPTPRRCCWRSWGTPSLSPLPPPSTSPAAAADLLSGLSLGGGAGARRRRRLSSASAAPGAASTSYGGDWDAFGSAAAAPAATTAANDSWDAFASAPRPLRQRRRRPPLLLLLPAGRRPHGRDRRRRSCPCCRRQGPLCGPRVLKTKRIGERGREQK